MSDCANGGRNVYEPTCTIKIEFDGDERLWVYPLALNGRKISRVTVGGVEYGPSDIDEQWITEVVDGKLTITAIEMGETRFEPVRECKLEKRSWDDGQCTWGVVCTACGYRHEHETGTCWNRCPECGAHVRR